MDGMLQAPAATRFDAIASILSLAVYLGAALVMIARRPREAHARVFLVIALASAAPYTLSTLQWWKGSGVYTPVVIACTAAAFSVGSTALFHFTQVFPWRRPWIRAHLGWLIACYVVPVLPVALVAWVVGNIMSVPISEASAGITEALIILGGLPAIFLIGIVLPLAGVLSLVGSWREAKEASNEPARVTTFWMLVSQLAGGVLAVLVLPLLDLIGVPAIWSAIFAGLAYACALIMPIAYFRTSV